MSAIENNDRLTAEQVAEYLGVSKDTVYTMAKRQEIPHYRLRRRYMFSKSSIDEWIREQERQSVANL